MQKDYSLRTEHLLVLQCFIDRTWFVMTCIATEKRVTFIEWILQFNIYLSSSINYFELQNMWGRPNRKSSLEKKIYICSWSTMRISSWCSSVNKLLEHHAEKLYGPIGCIHKEGDYLCARMRDHSQCIPC